VGPASTLSFVMAKTTLLNVSYFVTAENAPRRTYVLVQDLCRYPTSLCRHVSVVERPWLLRAAHSDSTQNFLSIFLIAASRAFAEKAPVGEAGRRGTNALRFGVKACWATSLYACIHSCTVMPNLPSIIAMILCSPSVMNPDRAVWLFSLPSGARAPNQVEEVAGSRDAVES
jgi:hypothetical protein